MLPGSIRYEIQKPLLLGLQQGTMSYGTGGEVSYAQEGEDLVLRRYLGNKDKGFFVDIGAHHPVRFSNTYLFYKKGWRGINIDAMPQSMKPFMLERPEDINLEVPVSDKEEEIDFYIFNEPALNTFSSEQAEIKAAMKDFKLIEKRKLKTRTLASILNEHVKPGTQIDFMSVDVEGFDHRVLSSNDWNKFRPTMIIVEDLLRDLDKIYKESEIHKLLTGKGYKLTAKTYNSVFYKLEE